MSNEKEPTITEQEMAVLFKYEDEDHKNLVVIEDNSGAKFLARNKGISDDGEGLNVVFLARIV